MWPRPRVASPESRGHDVRARRYVAHPADLARLPNQVATAGPIAMRLAMPQRSPVVRCRSQPPSPHSPRPPPAVAVAHLPPPLSCCPTDKTQGGRTRGEGGGRPVRHYAASLIQSRGVLFSRFGPPLSSPPPPPSPSLCPRALPTSVLPTLPRRRCRCRDAFCSLLSLRRRLLSLFAAALSSSPPPSPVPCYPGPLCDNAHAPPTLPFTLPSPILSPPPLRS